MKYSHVLWDFNGTVLDDVSTGIKAINVLLSRRKMKTLDTLEEYHAHFGFPIIEYYGRLGFDFEKEPYSRIAVEWVEEYNRFVTEATLCPGVIEANRAFRRVGARQVILSASEKGMLMGQLNDLGIASLFDEVLGCDNIEAHGKVHIGLEWLRRTRPERAVMIGDTEHDAEVAREMGIECLLVAKGHQSKEVLSRLGVPVFDSLFEVIEYITGHSNE